jgi:hypothetical protein
MQAELDGVLSQLRDERERKATLEQRASELAASEARAETEAAVWREAHAAGSAKALALEADKGALSAGLRGIDGGRRRRWERHGQRPPQWRERRRQRSGNDSDGSGG